MKTALNESEEMLKENTAALRHGLNLYITKKECGPKTAFLT